MDGCVARHMPAKVPAFDAVVPARDPDPDQGRNPAYVIEAPAQLAAAAGVTGAATPNRRARGAGPGDPKASRCSPGANRGRRTARVAQPFQREPDS